MNLEQSARPSSARTRLRPRVLLHGPLLATALLAASAAGASASTLTVSVHDNGKGGAHGLIDLGKSVIVTAVDNTPTNVVVTKSTDDADLLLTAGPATTLRLATDALAQAQCRVVIDAVEVACARAGVDPTLSPIQNVAPLQFLLGSGSNSINTAASPVTATVSSSSLTPVPIELVTPVAAAAVPAVIASAEEPAGPAVVEDTARSSIQTSVERQVAFQQRAVRLSAKLASGLRGAGARRLRKGWKISRRVLPTETMIVTLLLPVSGHPALVLASGRIAAGKSSVTLKRRPGIPKEQWRAALNGARLVSRLQILGADGSSATASTTLRLH